MTTKEGPLSRGPNFDRVARLYRWAEYLCYGPLLQRVRTHLLDEVLTCKCALVLGDGDGRFLARFLEANPTAGVLAVDTSAEMLRLLREGCVSRHTGARARLRTLNASALDVTPPRHTDLVVSHFFLDCLSEAELRDLVHHLAGNLPEGARWLVSDFDLPRSPWLRPFGRTYLRLLYAAFQLLTGLQVSHLPPISSALRDAGFVRIRRSEFVAGMLYTEMWQLGARGSPGETSRLAQPVRQPAMEMNPAMTQDTAERHTPHDAQPNPEPPAPSLPEPDPGVFHHAPAGSARTAPPLIPLDEEQAQA